MGIRLFSALSCSASEQVPADAQTKPSANLGRMVGSDAVIHNAEHGNTHVSSQDKPAKVRRIQLSKNYEL